MNDIFKSLLGIEGDGVCVHVARFYTRGNRDGKHVIASKDQECSSSNKKVTDRWKEMIRLFASHRWPAVLVLLTQTAGRNCHERLSSFVPRLPAPHLFRRAWSDVDHVAGLKKDCRKMIWNIPRVFLLAVQNE